MSEYFDSLFCVFFFKQKTAYELRISDWSSDVCSSDLNRENHGSYFFDWTTKHEVQWRNFYKRFMALVNDYKNMGGRVTTGTDSGFIFKTYGFGFPEEMEMLQEAGFNPHEVVQAATMKIGRAHV